MIRLIRGTRAVTRCPTVGGRVSRFFAENGKHREPTVYWTGALLAEEVVWSLWTESGRRFNMGVSNSRLFHYLGICPASRQALTAYWSAGGYFLHHQGFLESATNEGTWLRAHQSSAAAP